ncbi:hypothetical protein O181_105208 [Austropuccinia psidii MF-1]|uniref:Reverse transcriptase Ty1/copia-type domain-containing protein n=1 Tax=Austropuccinia psidii MF-1 TaxID=1389203 RepID=A0A9Q3JLN5_9BASI|nr:hypothetical protein [Austropuccinia psidii MF-1]
MCPRIQSVFRSGFWSNLLSHRHLNLLHMLLVFASTKSLEFHQVDINRAFLNAPLVKTVYLKITQGLNTDQRKHCSRLKKEIYGLKKAPLSWYERLKNWLQTVGFSLRLLDSCTFFQKGDNIIWLYIHIDDIAIFVNRVDSLKRELEQEFEIKDLGRADLLLGLR